VEQESLGGCVFQYPRAKLVMTAPVEVPLVGMIKITQTSKEALLEFWRAVERKTGLTISYKERVESVTPRNGGFLVRTSKREYATASVLLAIGRRGTPRKLGVPGEELPKVVYRLIDPEQYAGQRVLVVGGGDSALEAATSIAEVAGTRVALSYRGETFVCDGETVHVAFSNSNQSRSPLASFITTYDVIVRDGLLGSVLSTGWALSNVADRQPKLVYEGLKKVDDRQVHQLRYQPRKHSDAEILLYFDAETFRHVKTVYSISLGNLPGPTIIESVNLRAERSQLEERFSEFKTVDGLTLPTHWNLQFTRELPNGSTTVSEWDLKEDQITNNMGLDPRNFEMK